MKQIPFNDVKFDDIKLETNGFENVRTDLGNLDELLDDITTNGLHTTLTLWEVEDGEYVLVDGHRRYAAIEAIRKACPDDNPFETLSCGVFHGSLVRALGKNLELALQTEGLHPADIMKRAHYLYTEMGNQNKVAELIGRSQGWVSVNVRVFTNLIQEGFTALRADFINMGQAQQLSEILDDDGNPDVETQKEVLHFLVTGKKLNPVEKAEKVKTKRTKKEVLEMYGLALQAKESPDVAAAVPLTIIKVLEWMNCKLELPDVFSEEDVALNIDTVLAR